MKTFVRKIEDFACGKCGVVVVGDGYTNHCSKCLWSKHVDISPGDRLASCQGFMEPILAFEEHDRRRLLHRCVLCGHEKVNDVSEKDDFEAFLSIIKKSADRLSL